MSIYVFFLNILKKLPIFFMTLGIYHRLIKKKRGVTVTDSGISEVKSSFVPNGV